MLQKLKYSSSTELSLKRVLFSLNGTFANGIYLYENSMKKKMVYWNSRIYELLFLNVE